MSGMGGSGTGNGTGMVSESARRVDAFALWAREASTEMTPLQRMEGLRQVNARLQLRKRQRAVWLVLSILGLTAASAGAVLLVRWQTTVEVQARDQGRAIAYSIQGGEIGDGGYIRSFGAAGSLLHFEEGTELRLMTGARGRLSSVDGRGARFAIEEGEAEVKVTPRPGARWLVDAGPFLITVHGTVFTASWNGDTERLDVHLKKGLVSVTGPFADGMMAVRAGQHLSVNVKTNEVLLRQAERADADDVSGKEESPSEEPPETAAMAPAISPHTTAPARSSHGPASRISAPLVRTLALAGGHGWSSALVGGDLDSILRDAEHLGLRRVMAQVNIEDLAALADAARYRRRNDVARQALLSLRERFPRSLRASDSAFLLGRLDEAYPGGEGRALQWYDLYLKEAPSGAYSSEALGRKMTALGRTRDGAAAGAVAREYLRRYPDGAYAGAARVLRAAP